MPIQIFLGLLLCRTTAQRNNAKGTFTAPGYRTGKANNEIKDPMFKNNPFVTEAPNSVISETSSGMTYYTQ